MAAPREPKESIRYRRLGKPEEFRQVEEVQRAAFGLGPEGTLPPPLQRALQDNGGLVLGAFVDITLVGFSLGFLGWDGRQLYHYSHMTAVRPEYQNHHVGSRLKGYQREEVLAQGLTEMRWTFDPLQSRNALLNVRRLGAYPTSYLPHYYGRLDDAVNRELETDRVIVRWELSSERVVDRLAGGTPTPADDRARWDRSLAMVETEPGESGIRLPTAVGEPSGPSAHLEIPFDLDLVRQHEPKSLWRWRHAVRDAFRAAYDLRYRVDDFAVVSTEHERRSFYFLSPGPKEDPAAVGPPPEAAGAPEKPNM